MSRFVLLFKISIYHTFSMLEYYRIGYQTYFGYSVKKSLETVDLKPFFYTKDIIWEMTHFPNFFFRYQIYDHMLYQ